MIKFIFLWTEEWFTVVQTENRQDGVFHGKILRHLSRIKFWECSETSFCRFDTLGEWNMSDPLQIPDRMLRGCLQLWGPMWMTTFVFVQKSESLPARCPGCETSRVKSMFWQIKYYYEETHHRGRNTSYCRHRSTVFYIPAALSFIFMWIKTWNDSKCLVIWTKGE